MTEQQIPKLVAALVEHQKYFGQLSTRDAQWAIEETEEAISLFCHAVKDRAAKSAKLTIDRSLPFDPVEFIGPGWTIDEQDERSLALTEVDFSKASFVSGVVGKPVTGEVKLMRLKIAGRICFDAKIGQALFEEEGQTTLRSIHNRFNISWFELAGTVLCDPFGLRYFLCFFRLGGCSWGRGYRCLDRDRSATDVSPVLAS